MTEHSIATTTHGRFLTEPASSPESDLLLVGFHGYGENADIQLERLSTLPGNELWHKLSIQGLHRFYERRTGRIVASWMTSQNRDLAIADNLAFVKKCILAAAPNATQIVFAGFSQGVAMAFRAAASMPDLTAGIIACGGDLPPDLSRDQLRNLNNVLLARADHDPWYSRAQFLADETTLRDFGVDVTAFAWDAGHEWSGSFIEAASLFLASCAR